MRELQVLWYRKGQPQKIDSFDKAKSENKMRSADFATAVITEGDTPGGNPSIQLALEQKDGTLTVAITTVKVMEDLLDVINAVRALNPYQCIMAVFGNKVFTPDFTRRLIAVSRKEAEKQAGAIALLLGKRVLLRGVDTPDDAIFFSPSGQKEEKHSADTKREDAKGLFCYTIYDHPLDYPESYVVKRFIIDDGTFDQPKQDPTFCLVDSDVEVLRDTLRKLGLVRLDRDPYDDKVILETWI